METKSRTITSLRDILGGSIYVYLKTKSICQRFYDNAESEGFRFGDILPTESPVDDVIAIYEDMTLGHVGFVGHMKFHNPCGVSEEFHRIDYEKYSAGEKDFYYRKDGDRE